MALAHDDVAAARRAAQALVAAVTSLARHYPDTVDARRLAADAGRIAEDLDLLCGPATASSPPAPPPPREVIPDTTYAHDFWMDAEDEGLGSYDRRR